LKDLRDNFQKYHSALPKEKKRKTKIREVEKVPSPRSLRTQRRLEQQEMVSRAEISGEWDDGWSDGMSEVKLKFTFLFIQLQIVFSVIFRMNMKKAIQVIRVIR
jgi:hypothetical protein